jgi:eukaryotic-like serine/threonine-protein kinase
VERNLWPWLGALLLLVAGGVIAAVLLTRGGSHHKRTVPNVVGLTQAAAVSKVQNAGLKTSVANRFSSQPQGTVIAEKPAAGARIARGSIVTLTVSRGQKAVAVPNLTSLSQA